MKYESLSAGACDSTKKTLRAFIVNLRTSLCAQCLSSTSRWPMWSSQAQLSQHQAQEISLQNPLVFPTMNTKSRTLRMPMDRQLLEAMILTLQHSRARLGHENNTRNVIWFYRQQITNSIFWMAQWPPLVGHIQSVLMLVTQASDLEAHFCNQCCKQTDYTRRTNA